MHVDDGQDWSNEEKATWMVGNQSPQIIKIPATIYIRYDIWQCDNPKAKIWRPIVTGWKRVAGTLPQRWFVSILIFQPKLGNLASPKPPSPVEDKKMRLQIRLQKLQYYSSSPQFETNNNSFDKSRAKPQIAEFHKTAMDAKPVKK